MFDDGERRFVVRRSFGRPDRRLGIVETLLGLVGASGELLYKHELVDISFVYFHA
ncbi:hypothetical protein Tsubulata_001156, partial [Turnera subulata]